MATNKKKIIILCTMVVLLVASGYLNYVLTNKQPGDLNGGGDTTASSFFASAKAERQATRNREIAQYDAVIASSSSTAEAKAAAEASKLQLIAQMESEYQVETFLLGKGYAQAIVSCNSNNINVIVMDNELTAIKVAEIKNFIVNQTAYVLNQIIISQYGV
ncbi:MAG: SpoIIIAH-like family protein [Clostridiales bacterium]|jgi:stage III sporulation protein AH|nr:SpoIIIAH-like family protein [Clostridiales bacterium]